MMREPGLLHALDDVGLEAWNRCIDDCVTEAHNPFPQSRLASAVDGPAEQFAVEWMGLPLRATACVNRDRAFELLDRRAAGWTSGRYRLQEEYLEWRVVRDTSEHIRRIEFTTEFAEYWRQLAAYAPNHVLELVANFAGMAEVPKEAVFGVKDPLALTPGDRADKFASVMLPPGESPYNTGERALTCMVQPTNTLRGLTMLATAASVPHGVEDGATGRFRAMTAVEAIPLIQKAAVYGRASDPVIMERLGRLAFEGRRISLDDPLGVYIQDVEHTRLRLPKGGGVVPRDWFVFSRGVGSTESPDGRVRHQRLVIEAPPDCDYLVGDLVDSATEETIRFGGQIAELIKLGIYVWCSSGGASTRHDQPTIAASTLAVLDCEEVHRCDHEWPSVRNEASPHPRGEVC